LRCLDDQAIGDAILADVTPAIYRVNCRPPEEHWKPDHDADAIREWAEVNYPPQRGHQGIRKKNAVLPRRYLAIRVRLRQGEVMRDGCRVRHVCVVTNRSDPEWRQRPPIDPLAPAEVPKPSTMSYSPGAAFPSERRGLGANAAWSARWPDPCGP
jgi:hypothetical protein